MTEGLLGKAREYKIYKTLNGLLLVRTVGNDPNGSAADNSQGKYAEKALGVDAAFLLFDPNGGLVFIGLLDKEGCGAGVQSDLVLNHYIFNKH